MSRLLRALGCAAVLAAFATGSADYGTLAQTAQPRGGSADTPSQAPPADAQPADQPAQPPQATFKTGIDFVRVDVIVTDRNGNNVADLQPGDFEITEDDEPQKVETFKLIELDGGLMPGPDGPPRQIRTDADEENEAARDDVRLFAIFFDDYHVRQGTSLAAREQIARFIDTQLGPSDMVGLMQPLDPVASVRFSRNHDALRRGVERLLGRKFDYTPRNDYEQQYAYYPTEVVERIRNQVSMSALESLMSRMGALKEGRKALILVTEGYTNILPPQMRNPIAAMPGLGNPARGDATAGDNPLENRAQAFASFDLLEELRQVWSAANRHNVAIYAVDPRGLATNAFDIDENVGMKQDRTYLNATMDTLRTLAEETDGRAIVNRNDITIAMKQIVQDTSAYYLLGYTTTRPSDGKFHEIKVRVRRPGIQVRARKGYWALTQADVARATKPPAPAVPQPVQSALAAIGAPVRARVVRTWVGSAPGDGGRTAMTFVWEPVPRPAGTAAARGGDAPAHVTLLAAGADGTPHFRGRAEPGTPITFDAPPGDLQLRITAETASGEVLDTETRDQRVPDFTVPQTVIGTPRVFRARTVREVDALKANPQAAPTPAREFARNERVFVQVTVHAPGVTMPAVRARLLNRSGDAMTDLALTGGAGSPVVIDVPLASLPPGEYVVEVTATGGSGDVQEHIGFRVVG